MQDKHSLRQMKTKMLNGEHNDLSMTNTLGNTLDRAPTSNSGLSTGSHHAIATTQLHMLARGTNHQIVLAQRRRRIQSLRSCATSGATTKPSIHTTFGNVDVEEIEHVLFPGREHALVPGGRTETGSFTHITSSASNRSSPEHTGRSIKTSIDPSTLSSIEKIPEGSLETNAFRSARDAAAHEVRVDANADNHSHSEERIHSANTSRQTTQVVSTLLQLQALDLKTSPNALPPAPNSREHYLDKKTAAPLVPVSTKKPAAPIGDSISVSDDVPPFPAVHFTAGNVDLS
jgi:hypothetical protein